MPRSSGAPNQPTLTEEQAQIMNAFLGGAFPTGGFNPAGISDGDVPPDANPLAALMSSMNAGGPNPFAGMSQAQTQTAPKPKSFLQKFMPLIHLVAMWILLAYFVIWKEPEVYDSQTHELFVSEKTWKRWAELNWTSAGEGWGVQPLVSFPHYVHYGVGLKMLSAILLGVHHAHSCPSYMAYLYRNCKRSLVIPNYVIR